MKFGLGSMPKADIDALVMYLLDKYGGAGKPALACYSNQIVSERLKTPVAKIKKLRYEAALKFTQEGELEKEAKKRLLSALKNATLEADEKENKICFLIEDNLAKNWLQGQLKTHQMIFDQSFNTEIVKVHPEGLFKVLEVCFGKTIQPTINEFREHYNSIKENKNIEQIKSSFRKLIKSLVVDILKSEGVKLISSQVFG